MCSPPTPTPRYLQSSPGRKVDLNTATLFIHPRWLEKQLNCTRKEDFCFELGSLQQQLLGTDEWPILSSQYLCTEHEAKGSLPFHPHPHHFTNEGTGSEVPEVTQQEVKE